jgi:hypothetical protein
VLPEESEIGVKMNEVRMYLEEKGLVDEYSTTLYTVEEIASLFSWRDSCIDLKTAKAELAKLIAIATAGKSIFVASCRTQEQSNSLIQNIPTSLFTCNYRMGCANA